jgi:transcriptional regulator with XRE-family HTH domain
MSNEVGNYIRLNRKKAKMTLKELGEGAGISYPYISTLETGKRENPSAETLNKIAGALGIPSLEIMTIAGYLSDKKNEETSSARTTPTYKKDKSIKLNSLHPLELLETLKPDILSNAFFHVAKKSRLLLDDDDVINVLLNGIKKEATSKEVIDVMLINHKELLNIYIFIVAMADYVGVEISNDAILKFTKNPQDNIANMVDELRFDGFKMWYKLYFSDGVLSDYGDFELSNPATFTFDLSPLLESDTVLVNGKILNIQILKSIKVLLADFTQ